MAASSEGEIAGALTSNTYRGLYTSTDAGQTWTYNSLFSGGTAEATSATSVVYNATPDYFSPPSAITAFTLRLTASHGRL